MEDILNPDLTDILTGAATVALGFLSIALAFAVRWVASETKSDLLARAVNAVRIAVITAVKEVMQEYVSAIKAARADGKLTEGEKMAARASAIARAKSYLGSAGLGLLWQAFGLKSAGEIDTFIRGHVEAAIHDVKRAEVPRSGPLPSSAAG